MVNPDGVINAFSVSTGVTPDHFSLVIRSILCALFLIWAGWNVYGQYQLVQTHALDIHDSPMAILRILFLCALMVILVFIA